jgi:hypothetical protein
MVALKKRAVPESCENIYDVILEYEDKPGWNYIMSSYNSRNYEL